LFCCDVLFERCFLFVAECLLLCIQFARRAEGNGISFFQTLAFTNVANDVHPLVKVQEYRIIAVHGFGYAIVGLFVFGLKSSENAIPYNERRAVILVEIPFVAGMVNTMV